MANRKDPGFGPPPGSVGDSPWAQSLSFEQQRQAVDDLVGVGTPVKNDPAFQLPHDLVTDKGSKSRATLVYRDLPLVTIQNTWSVQAARAALYSHNTGIFEQSSQLWEAILGDDRVTATLDSRASGLFGRDVKFVAADDSDAAKECLRAWEDWWPCGAGTSAIRECNDWSIGLGFAPSQIVWDTSRPIWGWYLRPWNPRYTYFHWQVRRFIALGQDGQIPIVPGDGKWLLHAPFGEYRGWIRGAIRAVSEPWMLRHFAYRDMARYSEVHGQPTRVGKVPAVCDKEERAYFEAAIANLGAETSMILPQGVDGQMGSGYDYGLVEAKDRAWQVFGGLIERCDTSIVLAIMSQNLTTEVTGGSFAATTAHMGIRQSRIQGDNAAWKNTIYNQLARPFAYFNFGDANLAPWTSWDVEPREDLADNARQFQAFGTAIEVLARGGLKFDDVAELRRFAAKTFGLDNLPNFTISDPPSSGGGFGA